MEEEIPKRFNFFTMFRDGFKSMTLGRILWTVVIVKLSIMLIIKLLFFPDFLSSRCKTDKEKADYVRSEILK
ncbi:MAG: hypothetical protein BGN96_03780 [Bacteroidales bacterium 45-6]|nr:MAG: hypothetical protein BGN96_03780 [Bacteroidales bacterium 45-6]